VAPGSQLRVGRYLVALLAFTIAAYALIFVQHYVPKLGLDLRGGTSVTLTPKSENGKVTKSQLAQAVDIIRSRVNGIGVAEAEVVTQGNNVVISVPGKGREEVINTIGSTAQLRFREVLQELPPGPGTGTPAVSPSPAASPAPAAPAATPSPSASPRGRAVTRDLLAAGAPAPAAPAAPAAGSSAPTGSPAAAPVPTPQASAAPAPESGSPASVAALAALDCTKAENRKGTGSLDKPEEQIVACDRDGKAKFLLSAAKVVGTDVKGANALLDQNGTGQWQVDISFTGSGQDKFTKLTEATVGKQVAIVLDGSVVSAPVIQVTIPGNAQITGNFTKTQAQDLANVLKYGALPITFITSQAETISPSLGADQLNAGLIAGGIGLALVVLYSMLYYRGLGLVTIASLAVAAALSYASVAILGAQIGFTLTLAGIAGLIVSIGITADSFVVYFERIKDEVRDGRTLRSGVERGWVRARRTIISADFVSFLAAVILYLLSVGAVRGFAFTLGLSTVIDIAVVFMFTRPVMSVLARFPRLSGPGFTGLRSVARAGPPPEPAAATRRPAAKGI